MWLDLSCQCPLCPSLPRTQQPLRPFWPSRKTTHRNATFRGLRQLYRVRCPEVSWSNETPRPHHCTPLLVFGGLNAWFFYINQKPLTGTGKKQRANAHFPREKAKETPRLAPPGPRSAGRRKKSSRRGRGLEVHGVGLVEERVHHLEAMENPIEIGLDRFLFFHIFSGCSCGLGVL